MWLFAGRTAREILRDPLSFVFCLGVPLIMLVAMYALFSSLAPGGLFSLDSLTPGIAVFSGTFTMLYVTLLVSRDRTTWFLTRLYTSPMRNTDFVLGYALPGILIGLCQVVICYLTAMVTGLVTGSTDWISGRIFPAILCLLPIIVTYVFTGILFGSLFSDKAAPGLSSIVISAAGFLSGAWMPLETLASGFQAFCAALPFYPAVRSGRTCLAGASASLTGDGFWRDMLVCTAYAAGMIILACLAFRFHARREAE
jgi:ABC-2 type transport system permease protein